MSNKISVEAIAILEAYCFLRQIERGIDAAMSESWVDFHRYYAEKSRDRMDRFVESLLKVYPHMPSMICSQSAVFGRSAFPIINRFRRKVMINALLLHRIIQFLNEFKVAIESYGLSVEAASGLMLKAIDLRSGIERAFRGIRGLKEAKSIEHYFRNLDVTTYSIDEILQIHSGKRGKGMNSRANQ